MSWKIASLVSCSLLAGAAGVTSAQPRGPEVQQASLARELTPFASDVLELEATGKADGQLGPGGTLTTKLCLELVDKGEQLGIPADRKLDGGDGRTYLFRDAGALCRKFGSYQATVRVLIETENQKYILEQPSKPPGEITAEGAHGYAESARKVIATLDAAVATGADPNIVVDRFGVRESIATRKADFQKVVDWAAGYAVATEKVIAGKKAAVKERYARFGAAGDKLEWLLYYDPDGTGSTWYVPPSCKGVDDPRALAKAKVLIRWTVDDDGTQHLRRLQFKGNKLVKDTERSFLTEAAAYRGCK